MPAEIERKFLVVSDAWREHASAGERMRQGYLARAARGSVRVRVCGERAWLNIKSATVGVSRLEYEYPIPVAEGREMLERLCLDGLIEKTRYYVKHAAHRWEVDVFEGENAGLVVAEIELASESEPFEHPAWLGAEVSHDVRYYNSALAEHPFSRWMGT